MIKIKVKTLFDITATGTVGHFKSTRLPYRDSAGQEITDQISWNRSRNQQRNLETLLQILSLRTQVFEVTAPVAYQGQWSFEFAVETPGVFGEEDDFSVLYNDADGVPMLLDLNNQDLTEPVLITIGSKQNLWFSIIPINTSEEKQHG